MKPSALIELQNVSVTKEGTQILHDISTEIPSNQLVAIIGRSGAGKSTMLRLFNKFESPSRGQLLLWGKPLSASNPTILRRKIRGVFQGAPVFEGTVIDNMKEACRITEQKWNRSRAENILIGLGIAEDKFEQEASSLSGGEAQRLALARALQLEYEALLLDEPTSALDIGSSRTVLSLIKSELQEGKTCISILHDIELAREFADHVIMLQDGKLIDSLSASEFFSKYSMDELQEVFRSASPSSDSESMEVVSQ